MLKVNGAQAATLTTGLMVTQVGNTRVAEDAPGMVNSSLPLKRVLWSILLWSRSNGSIFVSVIWNNEA